MTNEITMEWVESKLASVRDEIASLVRGLRYEKNENTAEMNREALYYLRHSETRMAKMI